MINLLIDSCGRVLTDPFEMANLFQKQFVSVFSDPNSPLINDTDFTPPTLNSPFEDLTFDTSDIEDAID